MNKLTTAFALLTLAAPALAQTSITVRDTITPLPPISFCQDGATHVTTCTNLRLRPGSLASLVPFEGQAIEVTGVPGAVTCSFVTVSSITRLPSSQSTTASNNGTTMTVQFTGTGQPGDVYLLFLGLALGPSTTLPGITGTVHLDSAQSVFVGIFVPQGATPFHTISLPTNPALQGVDFFDQSLALNGSGNPVTTNVDCFRF